MDMIGKIRRLSRRGKKSEREISRLTGLHGELEGEPKYRREGQPNKLTAFHGTLVQALKADARRPKRERRTAKALFAELQRAGYDGG